MRKVYYDLLYLSSCGVNRIAPSEACLTAYQSNQETLQKLYRFSRAHFLDALIGMTLQRAGVTLPVKWCEDIAKAVRKTILLDAERTKILLFMERNGIWYLPLKGILLKDYYPSVGMRRISDNDILFDEAYADKLAQYMVSQGYTPLFVPNSNHDIYRKEPVYNFEMHRALYAASNRNNWADYYRDIKARLLPEPGTSYGYRMGNEDFYIYLVSHAYKHYANSGAGVRTLLDFYVYLEKEASELDFSYVERECELLGIGDFEKKNRVLCKKVFAAAENERYAPDRLEKSLTAEESEMLLYYLSSGVYGTWEHNVENRMKQYETRDGSISKVKYVWHRIFPGREVYRQYPFLSRHKYLLPIAWLRRLFRVVAGESHRKRIRRELHTVRKTERKMR